MSGTSSDRPTAHLMVRLEPKAKAAMVHAAQLRSISTSDYVRSTVVAQAERELGQAEANTLALSPAEQEAFWQALHEPIRLTQEQKRLGRLMQAGG